MTRDRANRILDLQRAGEADFSLVVLTRALHATGDIVSEWSMPRHVVTIELPARPPSETSRARFLEAA